MRKVQLFRENYYHVFNRGVDKRVIFNDDEDRRKFLQSLYLFNDSNYENSGHDPLKNDVLLAGREVFGSERTPLVSVVSFCLLPNHFHLFLKQHQEDGVSKFMHKIGTGYTGYFNRKNERSGRLFESVYKAVHAGNEGHFLHLARYIHLNALDLTGFSWRDGRVTTWEDAEQYLDAYPWSSHQTYLGKEPYLPILDMDEVKNIFPNVESYRLFLREWSTREFPGDLPSVWPDHTAGGLAT